MAISHDQMVTDDFERSVERRYRIVLTMAALAYEYYDEPILSDGDFDLLAKEINPELATYNEHHQKWQSRRIKKLDKFWREKFEPDTGMWIRSHPEIDRANGLYLRCYQGLKLKIVVDEDGGLYFEQEV